MSPAAIRSRHIAHVSIRSVSSTTPLGKSTDFSKLLILLIGNLALHSEINYINIYICVVSEVSG